MLTTATSNRLLSTSVPGDRRRGRTAHATAHDAHGNMISMPHLPTMGWDFKDQLQTSNIGGGGDVYFMYDATGQRVRKVWEHSGLVEERIYVGGYEVYQKRSASDASVALARQTPPRDGRGEADRTRRDNDRGCERREARSSRVR